MICLANQHHFPLGRFRGGRADLICISVCESICSCLCASKWGRGLEIGEIKGPDLGLGCHSAPPTTSQLSVHPFSLFPSILSTWEPCTEFLVWLLPWAHPPSMFSFSPHKVSLTLLLAWHLQKGNLMVARGRLHRKGVNEYQISTGNPSLTPACHVFQFSGAQPVGKVWGPRPYSVCGRKEVKWANSGGKQTGRKGMVRNEIEEPPNAGFFCT